MDYGEIETENVIEQREIESRAHDSSLAGKAIRAIDVAAKATARDSTASNGDEFWEIAEWRCWWRCWYAAAAAAANRGDYKTSDSRVFVIVWSAAAAAAAEAWFPTKAKANRGATLSRRIPSHARYRNCDGTREAITRVSSSWNAIHGGSANASATANACASSSARGACCRRANRFGTSICCEIDSTSTFGFGGDTD
jgi:hypothetical protein